MREQCRFTTSFKLLQITLLCLYIRCHSGNASLLQPQQHATTQVLTITEEEVFESRSGLWQSTTNRWKDSQGQLSLPPSNIQAPPTGVWVGDWKIVTSRLRDSFGWEYFWSRGNPALRRRIWLRSHAATPITTTTVPTANVTPIPSILKRDLNFFTFKGFGINWYKSCFLKDQVGMALRLPVTSNFNWWERHPGLPSVTTTFALYYPWCLIGYISCSINMEYIKWAFFSVLQTIHVAGLYIVLFIAKVTAFPLALLFFPITRSFALPTLHIPSISIPKPMESSQQIQEKIGCSISWRYYPSKSMTEFRFSQYYVVLPTLVYLIQLLQTMLQSMLQHTKQKSPLISTKWLDWLRTKTTSLGLSLGRPTNDPPGITCSAMLSVSGLYLPSLKQRQQQQISLLDHLPPVAYPVLQQDSVSSELEEGSTSVDDELLVLPVD